MYLVFLLSYRLFWRCQERFPAGIKAQSGFWRCQSEPSTDASGPGAQDKQGILTASEPTCHVALITKCTPVHLISIIVQLFLFACHFFVFKYKVICTNKDRAENQRIIDQMKQTSHWIRGHSWWIFIKKSINIPFSHRLKLLSVSEKLISLYKGPYKTVTGHCRLIDPSGESLINVGAPCWRF